VIEFIADDGVPGPEQGFEQAAVGIEAGTVEDGVLGAEEFRYLCLQLLVGSLGAADEPDGTEAVAPAIITAPGRGDPLSKKPSASRGFGSQVKLKSKIKVGSLKLFLKNSHLK